MAVTTQEQSVTQSLACPVRDGTPRCLTPTTTTICTRTRTTAGTRTTARRRGATPRTRRPAGKPAMSPTVVSSDWSFSYFWNTYWRPYLWWVTEQHRNCSLRYGYFWNTQWRLLIWLAVEEDSNCLFRFSFLEFRIWV